jgi:hypothetical protein
MNTLHVSLAFAKDPAEVLVPFTNGVITMMTGNAAFPTPDVALSALTASMQALETAMAATVQGGTEATAAQSTARTALIGLLRTQALYVEMTSAGNLVTLLSSGFKQRTISGASSSLGQTAILAITNNATTQLMIKLLAIANAKAFEVQTSVDGINWVHNTTSSHATHIVLTGLTPGVKYYIRARAIGGSTGFGDWSDTMMHMAM